jgi:transmembrane sensor
LKKKMNIEILLKYLNTNCSDKEFEELANWVKQNGQNKEGRSWSCDQWKMFDPELKMKDEKKYSALLDKIHHDINLKSGEIENTKLINIINIFVSNNGTKKNSF